MMQDIKELIGVIMRILDHGEIAEAEIVDLDFEAEGELQPVLNEAYVQLLEFVHDRELRRADPDLDGRRRAALQDALHKIVLICDAGHD
ncbi:hypothetical protein [Bradyrhizobium sp. SK17]|jgi:hypothetical protein|uniref:hypothetical protein n=1 Tax=Bradyrhizobium sp. SK17 TaxID=2057741 RepID=UPI001AECB9FF|nr:hypothetical protein [Bradyrhizobium sp. SK17]